jgi:hypothetical protein
MLVGARGIKALIAIILVLAFLLALFLIALQIFLIILPIVLLLALLGGLWRLLSKKRKETVKAMPAQHIDVKYKVKE